MIYTNQSVLNILSDPDFSNCALGATCQSGGSHFRDEISEREKGEIPVPSVMIVTALHMGKVGYARLKTVVLVPLNTKSVM